MTDRVNALTVVLEKDVRVDDVQAITSAISMLKGVISVDENISDVTAHMAEVRAKRELGQKLLEVVYPRKG